MFITDAAREVLSKNAKPMSIQEILDEIVRLKLMEKKPTYGSVRDRLKRESEKEDSMFIRMGESYLVKPADSIRPEKSNKIVEFDYEEPNFEVESDLYITDKLLDQIKIKYSDTFFCKTINALKRLLEDWERHCIDCQSLNLGNYCKIRKPLILGTEDEVIEYRKEFKGRVNECQMKKLQIELINNISHEKVCDTIDKILELTGELEDLCDMVDHGRYAYYVPIKCQGKISAHPVSLSDRKCHIYEKKSKPKPGYIVMPYDIAENSKFIFTPKFYQALYHELFHSMVIDRYKGNKKINEGLAELYSELCYYQIFKEFAKRYFAMDIPDKFFDKYMLFTKEGSYLRYYNYVKKEFGYDPKRNHEDEYELFCSLISNIITESERNYREFADGKSYNDTILDCPEMTKLWHDVFVKSCLRCKIKRNV